MSKSQSIFLYYESSSSTRELSNQMEVFMLLIQKKEKAMDIGGCVGWQTEMLLSYQSLTFILLNLSAKIYAEKQN